MPDDHTYVFRISNGEGACVCDDCTCSRIDQRRVKLGYGQRFGWNGWDDSACRIYRELHAEATLSGTQTVTNSTPPGDSCSYSESVDASTTSIWTITRVGDVFTASCSAAGGSGTGTASGTLYDAEHNTCTDGESITNDMTPTCGDPFTTETPGCSSVQAFAFANMKLNIYDVLTDLMGGCTPGDPTVTSAGTTQTVTISSSGTFTGGDGTHVDCSLTDTLTVTLENEWMPADLLSEVTIDGSDDSEPADGSGTVAGVSTQSVEMFYREGQYRFLRPPVAGSATFDVVVERYRYGSFLGGEDLPGDFVEEVSRTPTTLALAARDPLVSGDQWTDWVSMPVTMPDEGYELVKYVDETTLVITCGS